ncbi:type II toxin-antitoxin system HipA family toxin [Nibricoccus sp. IMCC34717]|uniref:type II toxin-antitoxin system HipA family toxin n=1 Tax=Nibricoccus sp. IMCC34717 TaxID=3034021 RepID=UPI003850A636
MANVFVNRLGVGTLARAEPTNQFTYRDAVPPGAAISLLMPVNQRRYQAERPTVLHPIFDMNLPEGALREALHTLFAKALPVFDDLALLEIVGRSQIGRLRLGASADELDQVPAQSLKDLLSSRGTAGLFSDLLRRYAQHSGVAGVQPKLMLRDDGSLTAAPASPPRTSDRVTAQGATHLVKTFDAAKYPGLAANEFYCLKAARAAGLPTPAVEIGQEGRLLVIERFDRKPAGDYLAFEDGCALAGRLSREKYEGSYEQLAATLASALRGPDGTAAGLACFFRSLVLSVVVRNGDAHRKNFGVVYENATGAVSLAPAFDIITSTAYLPDDMLALTLDGTKRWPDTKRLIRFARQHCQLTEKTAREILSEVCEAVANVAHELPQARELDPHSEDLCTRMSAAWTEGIRSLS